MRGVFSTAVEADPTSRGEWGSRAQFPRATERIHAEGPKRPLRGSVHSVLVALRTLRPSLPSHALRRSQYRAAVGFVAILLVLTLRPRGLLGERAY